MEFSPLTRTQYWNLSTNTVRGGATAHGESLTDMESYLLPLAQMLGAGLYSWGVVDGLAVSAMANQPNLVVMPGAALDAAGHLIALAANGVAITDPTADPTQVQNVPIVPVVATGVSIATAPLTGEQYITISWREVQGQGQLANVPVMQHAPWLRLTPVAGFQATGEQIILARVSLDNNSQVSALTMDGRRPVGLPGQRLELRYPRASGAPGLQIDQGAGAELRARADGGLEINLPAATLPALAIDANSNLGLGTAAPGAKLEVNLGNSNDLALKLTSSGPGWGSGLQLSNTAANARTYGIYSGSDGSWHLADQTANADRLVIDANGNIGIGAATPQRRLHVEDTEIHSGGGSAGFSFGNRQSSWVDDPATGERWVWYADAGSARLWSHTDKLWVTPAGELNTGGRMTVHQGADLSAGIWFLQNGPSTSGAFVGMSDNSHVGLWGNNGAGWGLTMDTANRNVGIGGSLAVSGSLSFQNSAGGAVTLGGSAGPMNDLQPNNVKLVMGSSGGVIVLGNPLTYEFAIGHNFRSLSHFPGGIGGQTSFVKRFSVNAAGNVFFAGGKSGYVMDYFVNRVGDSLEQGDVVVIGEEAATRYLGTNNNVPVPEVDLTDRAYDTRVCGVVAQLVTEADLPFVEPEPVPEAALEAMRSTAAEAAAYDAGDSGAADQPYEHPWRSLAASTGSDLNRTPVANGQLGHMATLGAFAHCKVDADIAPVSVGDLLTTSPTRGHAQKVEDASKAAGAILGKALAGLESGKGKIPILIMLA